MDLFPTIPKPSKTLSLFNGFEQPAFYDSMEAIKKPAEPPLAPELPEEPLKAPEPPEPLEPIFPKLAPTGTDGLPKSPQIATTTFPAASASPIPQAPVKKQTLEEMHSDWAKNKKTENMQKILDELSSDIDKAIYAYSGLNAGPAVKSKAKVLAAKAIKTYDPKSGASLKSWVYTQLQPLSRYSRDLNPSPMPERAYQQLSSIKKHEAEFYENKGRPPSDAELADLTGMS